MSTPSQHIMAWRANTVIALITLFATCFPILVLVATFLIGRKRRNTSKMRKYFSAGNIQVSSTNVPQATETHNQQLILYLNNASKEPTGRFEDNVRS